MRKDHTDDFMEFVMTPPKLSQADYDIYKPVVSEMRVISNNNKNITLGDLPTISGERESWVGPVVIIVVSAMALMTLYAVLSDRKR